jgi:hypothetical protein
LGALPVCYVELWPWGLLSAKRYDGQWDDRWNDKQYLEPRKP